MNKPTAAKSDDVEFRGTTSWVGPLPNMTSTCSTRSTITNRAMATAKAPAGLFRWLKGRLHRGKSKLEHFECEGTPGAEKLGDSAHDAKYFEENMASLCKEVTSSENVKLQSRMTARKALDCEDEAEVERAVDECVRITAVEALRAIIRRLVDPGEMQEAPSAIDVVMIDQSKTHFVSEERRRFGLTEPVCRGPIEQRPHPMYEHRAKRCLDMLPLDSEKRSVEDDKQTPSKTEGLDSSEISRNALAGIAASPCFGADYIDAAQKWVDALDAEIVTEHIVSCQGEAARFHTPCLPSTLLLRERFRSARLEAKRFREICITIYRGAYQVLKTLETSELNNKKKVGASARKLTEILKVTRLSFEVSFSEITDAVAALAPLRISTYSLPS